MSVRVYLQISLAGQSVSGFTGIVLNVQLSKK